MTGPAPVGRLAPSPTGELHLGHARSFLLAWWDVRARGGRIVLRIEDLDRARVKPGMVERALEDLVWLGLDWDEGPYLQSQESGPMERALAELLARGLAYPCTCSRKDVRAALSAPHGTAGELRYPGTCRDRYDSLAEARERSGAAVGVRLRVPEGPTTVADRLHGAFTADVAADVGDFLLARRDGAIAYQLAVAVDDARQGITDVLRGDDLLPSTPRQWLLQEALGLPHPAWTHVPLVLDEHGARLAKRSGARTLRSLREAGVAPAALVGWTARSAGQEAPERAMPADVLDRFDVTRVPRVPVRAPALAARR